MTLSLENRIVRVGLLLMSIMASSASAQQNIVILLDDSGSMHEPLRSNTRMRKMDAAKSAIQTVLQQVPDDANVGLAVLNGKQNPWVIPLGPVDKSRVGDKVGKIRARGGTPLGAHMKIAADALLEAREKQRYGTYKLLIITDGEANDRNLVERYLPDIQSRGIIVDAIGVDMPGQHSLATKTSSYRRADDPDSLKQAISAVMAETTTDAGDTGESDFELLEGFPADVASAALEALASPSNQPIGGVSRRSNEEQTASATPNAASQNVSPAADSPKPSGGRGRTLVIFAIVVFIIFRAIMKMGKR